MHSNRMDNGEYFMRRYGRNMVESQHLAQQSYQPYQTSPLLNAQNPYNPHNSSPVTPGERPEPEDTTGLKMLEEFLAKRKGERDGK